MPQLRSRCELAFSKFVAQLPHLGKTNRSQTLAIDHTEAHPQNRSFQ